MKEIFRLTMQFGNKVKRYIFMDTNLMELPFSKRKEVYEYTVSLINNQILQLETSYQDTKLLTFEQYCNKDIYYTEIIKRTDNPIYLEDGSIVL